MLMDDFLERAIVHLFHQDHELIIVIENFFRLHYMIVIQAHRKQRLALQKEIILHGCLHVLSRNLHDVWLVVSDAVGAVHAFVAIALVDFLSDIIVFTWVVPLQ